MAGRDVDRQLLDVAERDRFQMFADRVYVPVPERRLAGVEDMPAAAHEVGEAGRLNFPLCRVSFRRCRGELLERDAFHGGAG